MPGNAVLVELAGALIAGGLGLPLPEELVLLTGGYHAWRGDVDARALIAVTLAAVLGGDATLYVLGRYGGRPLVQRFVGDARLERLDRAFATRGAVLMFFARFVPGLRSALLIAAGAGRMRVAQLAAWDGVAAGIGVMVWLCVGARLGPAIDHAAAIVDGARTIVLCAAVAAALIVWLARARRNKV